MPRIFRAVQTGFTLIELMLVVAIVAILGALALPTYQDYAIRAKVAEGFGLASAAKVAVIETSASLGGLANVTAANSGFNFSPLDSKAAYVDSITIADGTGVITVVTKNTGAKVEPAFTLTPTQTADQLFWECRLKAGLPKHVPAICRTAAAA